MFAMTNYRMRVDTPWADQGRWRRRAWLTLKLLLALIFLTTLGLTVGVMVVIMPPMAWIAVMGLAALFLLWIMPDLPAVPDDLIRKLFIISVIVQFVTPVYYAFAVSGLPWISFRRLAWFPTIILAGLAVAASKQARMRIVGAVMNAKFITFPAIGFFLWMCLSLLTSVSWPDTVSSISNAYLYWAMTFIICILCIRGDDDIRFILSIIVIITVIAGPLGFIEYISHDRFIVNAWPERFLQELFRQNPMLLDNLTRDIVRNGEFRAHFIFNNSLSYGEFLAVCAPVTLILVFHGHSWKGSLLGLVGLLMCVLGVFASGARGGFVGLAISVPFVIVLWLIRHMRENPGSMAGPIGGVTFGGAVMGFFTLVMVWQKLRWKFTGGYEGAGSTGIRWLQWEMALPSVIANPITGYGHGAGNAVVGYVTPGGMPTVDSYIITLVVEMGVPGLLLFFTMVGSAIVMMVRIYLTDRHPGSTLALGIAGGLLSFASYRVVLSQNENHFLLFLLLGFAVLLVSANRRRSIAPQAVKPLKTLPRQGPNAGFSEAKARSN